VAAALPYGLGHLRHLGVRGREDGEVDRAVLLGADERLAEREVAGLGRAGPQQGEHRELARRLGAREGDGGGVEEALEHGRLRGGLSC
jgi:hypothetical protein